MAIKYLSPIDMTNLQILNLQLEQSAGNKSGPVEGSFYYNSTGGYKAPQWYDGTTHQIVCHPATVAPSTDTVGASAAVGTSLDAARADHVHGTPAIATTSVSGFMSAADKTILNNATSTTQDAATKNYVDNAISGLDIKASVKVASTAALTLASGFAAGQIIDGYTLVLNDRILVKNQALPKENGIYIVTAATPTRALDADAWTELPGAFTFIEQGTTQADTGWVCTVDAGGTLGTTDITWAQFSGSGSWTAANDPGVTGTGVYDNTTGTQFRFRGIKAASTKIAIALSTKDITVDVTEANLTISNMGGTLGVAHGGTNLTAYTQYAMLYASTTGVLSQTTPNTTATNKFLTQSSANSNTPTWSTLVLSDLPVVDVAHGGTNKASWTVGSIPYASAATTIVEISPNATATQMVLTQSSSGAPTWQSLPSISGTRKATSLWSTATTSFAFTHNLATSDVVVVVRDATNLNIIQCDVVVTSTNVVTCTMAVAPAANAYTILVIG